jgi:hypothetical protein
LSWLFSYHQKDISFEIEQFNSDIKSGGFFGRVSFNVLYI